MATTTHEPNRRHFWASEHFWNAALGATTALIGAAFLLPVLFA